MVVTFRHKSEPYTLHLQYKDVCQYSNGIALYVHAVHPMFALKSDY